MKTIIREEIVYLREAEVEVDWDTAAELYYGDRADEIHWSEPRQTYRNVQFEDEWGCRTGWKENWN